MFPSSVKIELVLARVAQPEEQGIRNAQAGGSTPLAGLFGFLHFCFFNLLFK